MDKYQFVNEFDELFQGFKKNARKMRKLLLENANLEDVLPLVGPGVIPIMAIAYSVAIVEGVTEDRIAPDEANLRMARIIKIIDDSLKEIMTGGDTDELCKNFFGKS